jgi:predicted amidophosphoribosyltransferase
MDKLSRGTLGQKKCKLVTGLLTGHWALRWHLHIMGLSENAMCKKCKQEEEKSYHIFCPCLALAKYRVEIFHSAWIQLKDVRRVLALALRSGPYQHQHYTMNPAVV